MVVRIGGNFLKRKPATCRHCPGWCFLGHYCISYFKLFVSRKLFLRIYFSFSIKFWSICWKILLLSIRVQIFKFLRYKSFTAFLRTCANSCAARTMLFNYKAHGQNICHLIIKGINLSFWAFLSRQILTNKCWRNSKIWVYDWADTRRLNFNVHFIRFYKASYRYIYCSLVNLRIWVPRLASR